MRSSRSAPWLRALSALGLAVGCAARPEWPAILAEVRARYPDVPQLGVEELAARDADARPLLLDARAAPEYELSHLKGARWAPDEDAALDVLASEAPDREVVVYCSVGLRSAALAEKLRARGFTRVSNLEGGIFAWANEGLPMWRGEERVDVVHPYDARWGSLLRR